MLSLCLPLHGGENDSRGIFEATFEGDLKRVRELLTKNPDLLNATGQGGTPLCAATLLARKEVIE
jgi:hypothetical protein